MERKVEFWDKAGREELHYRDKNKAIESILDFFDPFPETIEICGYARVEKPAPEKLEGSVLENLIEHLDCDFELGHPDGDSYEITDGMKEAESVFIKAVLKEYNPWSCEIVTRETVDVQKWVRENRPDWLEELEKRND